MPHSTGSLLVAVDKQTWVVDAMISSAVLASFTVGYFITGTSYEHLIVYIDPLVVTLLVIIAVPVPLQIFLGSLRESFLAAPPDEIKQEIRAHVADALGSWPVVEHRVRMLKLGNTMNVMVHAKPAPHFELRSVSQLDEISHDVKRSLETLGYDVILDVIFVDDMRMAE